VAHVRAAARARAAGSGGSASYKINTKKNNIKKKPAEDNKFIPVIAWVAVVSLSV
jgi:hypothetical protein